MAKTERIQNMTKGSPAKLIFTFAIPLMLGNVFQQFYTVVDTAIVGQALGVNALAALGAADWLNWLVLGLIQGFAQGFSIYMAQRFGAEDHEGLNRAIGATISLSAVISILTVILSQVAMAPVLRAMNTPEEIIGGAFTYLRIMFAGIPIIMAYNVLASILRALGDSKTPLYAMVIASILNIGLDLLFVMVFHWGIAGAVIATVIAQLFAALYCLRAVLHVKVIHLKKEYFRLNPEIAKRLLGLGTPVAAQNVIIAVGGMVVQSVVNRYGTLFVAGFTATNKLYGILEIAAVSFGYAVTTYVGQNLGAGRVDRIKVGVRRCILMVLIVDFFIGGAMILFGRQLTAVFVSGVEQTVIEASYPYLLCCGAMMWVLGLLFVYRFSLQSLGDTVVPMLSGALELILRISVVLVLSKVFNLGFLSICIAEVSAWFGAAALLCVTYYIRIHKLPEKLSAKS